MFLIAKYPGHPVFRDPLFQSPQFNACAVKVREAAQETFEDDRATAIEKVIPRSLRSSEACRLISFLSRRR